MEDLSIGELFDAMTKCNIEIWHEATKIKTLNGVPRVMDASEKVAIGQEIRKLNAKRSAIRWEIDKRLMDEPLNDCKTKYVEED